MAELSILFFRRNCPSETKYTSIYCRITVDGKRTDFVTTAKSTNKLWNQAKQRLDGFGEMTRLANAKLSKLETDINRIYSDLERSSSLITPEIIKYELKGGDKSKYSILSLYEDEHQRMIREKSSDATKTSLQTSLSAMKLFLKKVYNQEDYPVHLINLPFLNKFKEWGETEKDYKNNSFITIVQPLKRILNRCHGLGIIKINPYMGFKLKADPAINKFLKVKEVAILENLILSEEEIKIKKYKTWSIKHTKETRELTRDLFIFSCYTGMAYADLKKLSRKDIVIDPQWGTCLSYQRTKTKVDAFTPLLKKPLEILNKYLERGMDPVFPVEPNPIYNHRLELLEKESGIGKKLTTHVGRHTSATFFLNNKMPVPVICAAIAISPEELMRTYGKVLEETVFEQFKSLDVSLKQYKQ